jgi:hypothetical protein
MYPKEELKKQYKEITHFGKYHVFNKEGETEYKIFEKTSPNFYHFVSSMDKDKYNQLIDDILEKKFNETKHIDNGIVKAKYKFIGKLKQTGISYLKKE